MNDLPAPMPLAAVIANILNPGLALLPIKMDSTKARVMLLAIGQQESRFQYRRQKGNGPARGFWQFERGGGVRGVLQHHATTGLAHHVCAERGVPFDAMSVWNALETDDLLACAVARLLLFSDPQALPELDDVDGAWNLYAVRTWRPGKPHRDTWDGYHANARAALGV